MAQSVVFPQRPKEYSFVNVAQVTITHNLNYIPNVQVLINGTVVYAEVTHTNSNELVVTFVNATTGIIVIR